MIVQSLLLSNELQLVQLNSLQGAQAHTAKRMIENCKRALGTASLSASSLLQHHLAALHVLLAVACWREGSIRTTFSPVYRPAARLHESRACRTFMPAEKRSLLSNSKVSTFPFPERLDEMFISTGSDELYDELSRR